MLRKNKEKKYKIIIIAGSLELAKEGNIKIKQDNLFEIWEIPKTTNVSVNERVLTSGFSDIFPSNLFVGKVVKIIDEPNFHRAISTLISYKPDVFGLCCGSTPNHIKELKNLLNKIG